MKIRTGLGYDVHKLADHRKLVLCGVEIPYSQGLLGHSDADVATHALIDALCGACNMGDIGKLFPDTDMKFKDISSMLLLEETMKRMSELGYKLGNADITIVAQAPKIGPHIPEMKKRLCEVMQTEEEDISIKATTTEHLGFTGRKEGIAAFATVLVEKV